MVITETKTLLKTRLKLKTMLVIRKDKDLYFVDHYGPNGRTLNHTKSFTQKPSAWVNIMSTVRGYGNKAEIIVQDHSLSDPTEPVIYKVTGKGTTVVSPKGITPKISPHLKKVVGAVKEKRAYNKIKKVNSKKKATKKTRSTKTTNNSKW